MKDTPPTQSSTRRERYVKMWEPLVGPDYAPLLWPARQVILGSSCTVFGGLFVLALAAVWAWIPYRGTVLVCAIAVLIVGVVGIEAGFVLFWRIGSRVRRDLIATGHSAPKWSPDLRSPKWFLRWARQSKVDSESVIRAGATAARQRRAT
jgi:hypothetical protein